MGARGAILVAIAASIGNFIQGWDNATISGAIVYIKTELALQTSEEGLVVAMSLIGATLITTCSGAVSDWLGRRPLLIISSVFYFLSGLVMLWSPNVYVLCIARLLDGFGIGLAVTLAPIYISETAPPDIRGSLNTLPQFTGSAGMFLSYCMIFGMSLEASPSWRLMLGILFVPSLLYFLIAIFFLPESPRWLVSKGKMLQAKKVLQRLRGREDVSEEMALLVEGLGIGSETSIEEYLIGSAADQEPSEKDYKVLLYGSEGAGLSWVAKPVVASGHSSIKPASRLGSIIGNQSMHLMDPLVTLFDSIHEKIPETGSMRSVLFPHSGSMFSSTVENHHHAKNEQFDEENIEREGDQDYYPSDAVGGVSDDDLRSPLISAHGSSMFNNLRSGRDGEAGIGGGWQLAWKWSEKEGGLKRVYLHQEGSRRGSFVSVQGEGEGVHVAGLVSQPALYSKQTIGPAMVHPSEVASKGSIWKDLTEPGVKHALIVGIGIQVLQQLAGINGVLYYTPQILQEAGVEILLKDIGISSKSTSFLLSAITTLLMLPCIALSMRLIDISGRRQLLLATIPVLIVSLVLLVVGNAIEFNSIVHALISTISVVVYFCCFKMAYGPIPNILCSEIFPTRVRGVCIAICALVFWIGNIIVTYTLPVMLSSIGLAGVFGIYAVGCFISWIFVFLKVPETKGMPLEVITEFFAVGARVRRAASAKNL
ncbi:monosaccharide-sensing protein 2-like [Arachis stenosperma]|uniref:monosaccharide-sensing protein 2-like n=1 Tax=Arachis stenosperma TaxID=217475 RepID=UPI0025AC928A|nr:monosaccharide-sensing protein 2-like [Arachis stenosperma]